MKHMVFAGLVGLMVAALAAPAFARVQEGSATATPTMVLGTVNLPRAVKVDGKTMPAGAYQVRLTADTPPPVVGQSPDAARYVEFLQGGKVVAREVATVVSNDDIVAVGKAPKPAPNSVKVQILKGDDYIRVWLNRAGNNYLIHLPTAA